MKEMNKELFIDWLVYWDTEECRSFENCDECIFENDCCKYQDFLMINHIKKG